MPQVSMEMSDTDRNSIGRQSLCSTSSSPHPVKIAVLCKRSQGLHRFTRPNYRHRVFVLTDQALSYYSGSMDVSVHICWERIFYCTLYYRE